MKHPCYTRYSPVCGYYREWCTPLYTIPTSLGPEGLCVVCSIGLQASRDKQISLAINQFCCSLIVRKTFRAGKKPGVNLALFYLAVDERRKRDRKTARY